MDNATPNLLLVAGPGLGHINGCLLLANSLLSVGLPCTLAWFARSYRAQQHRLPAIDAAIRFEVLDDGSSPGSESYQDLFTATPEMKESLVQLVERLSLEQVPVCCIVSDTFMPWTQDVADRFRIPRVDYWSATATAYSMILALPKLISQGHIPQKDLTSDWRSENPIFIDCMPGYSQFPLEEIPKEFRGADISSTFLQNSLAAAAVARKADRVLIHSLYHLESNSFDGLRESQYKPYAIGPLLKYASDSTSESSDKHECLRWLETQAEGSVIFVSFGSNALLSDKEILELAAGLEASESPFLFVNRSDQAKLPEGFEARTKGRGRIVPWAPQVAVLSHRAVGGFLTHCGWNSTLESMWTGVPMLGCPRQADQRTNARFMSEKWRVGMELGRTKEGGIERDEVARAVKALMIGKEAQQVRSRAREMRETLRNAAEAGGDSHSNLLQFVNDVRTRYRLRPASPP